MEFKTGQKVVCINPTCTRYCKYPLKKGAIYTVDGFYQCECGSRQVSISEKPAVLTMYCGCSRSANRRQTYYNWRFIPLELLTNFISLPSQSKTPQKPEL
jgi:hypothetical protein